MSHKPDINLNAEMSEVYKRLAAAAVAKDMERALAAPQGHGATFGGRTRATSLGDRAGRPGRKPEHTQALADNLEYDVQVQQAQAVVDAAAIEGFISEGGQ
jgi:hypothetical protein